MSEHVKLPQILVANATDPELVSCFLMAYRPSSSLIPSNLPTACLLEGKKGSFLREVGQFFDDEEVFIYAEAQDALRKDRVGSVVAFWNSREPWEDYDFCMFPRSLEWCVGFTHNDYCVLAKRPNQPLQRNASTGSVSNFESPARRG